MNPYDLTGPSFLGLLTTACLISGTAAVLVRKTLQDSYPCKAPVDPQLSAYEVAYLSGRENTVIQAVLANLIQSGTLNASSTGQSFLINNDKPSDPDPLVLAVKNRLSERQDMPLSRAIHFVKYDVRDILMRIENRLALSRLLFDKETGIQIAVISAAIMELPVLFAIPKLLIGIERGKPVDFLIVEMMLVSFISFVFMLARPFRTKAGDEVLEKCRFNESALKTTASTGSANLSSKDAAMAVALFSTAIFAAGPLYDMRRAMTASTGGSCSSGSGCGSSCGGGGCGGGCGGCGG
ncbi:MAG: TIGR04222 domain-containing membrane protein [Candidatus Obscuribacterales bacterium]|jgi:uncharacterized protein (TIGR04222 family)|nr:TIGR04222 domain-containing membrane protein [Candidatus Obscuribacterales bacterium]